MGKAIVNLNDKDIKEMIRQMEMINEEMRDMLFNKQVVTIKLPDKTNGTGQHDCNIMQHVTK